MQVFGCNTEYFLSCLLHVILIFTSSQQPWTAGFCQTRTRHDMFKTAIYTLQYNINNT